MRGDAGIRDRADHEHDRQGGAHRRAAPHRQHSRRARYPARAQSRRHGARGDDRPAQDVERSRGGRWGGPVRAARHGRVLVTQPTGDRRICDCTITGLSGVGRDNLLVALYDRTDELRAQRELIAREKLATVGEIASGVAHEVNNPLAAIRMEAELLGRSSKDPDTNTEHVYKGREPAVIQLTTQAREGWVRLVVEDSGPGVPPEIRGRIFDPFFTTKGPDEGTGLGLAICQRVVTEVGGKLWLEDSSLGGARFVVELPAAPEQVSTAAIG